MDQSPTMPSNPSLFVFGGSEAFCGETTDEAKGVLEEREGG